MKNYVFLGAQKFCYQWIYAIKTKNLVDKIKELNSSLRDFQKNFLTQEKTIKFIDDLLLLEKLNFYNVINIFDIKMNFLKNFENGNNNLNEKFIERENCNINEIIFEEEIHKRILNSKGIKLIHLKEISQIFKFYNSLKRRKVFIMKI